MQADPFIRFAQHKYSPYVFKPLIFSNLDVLLEAERPKMSFGECFDNYLRKKLYETNTKMQDIIIVIFRNVDNATILGIHHQSLKIIRDTILSIKDHMDATSAPLKPLALQLFQTSRWDFMLKEDLSVHLIEVNDSPDMGEPRKYYAPDILDILEQKREFHFNVTGVMTWRDEGEQIDPKVIDIAVVSLGLV